MPQFNTSSVHTAKAVMRNPTTKPFDYKGILYMGINQAVMTEALFRLNAGESKEVSFAVTMPGAAGTYPVYIGVFSGDVLIPPLYRGTEDVVIVPSALVLTAKNMPGSLWSGQILELVSDRIAREQSWGVCNITLQPVTLEPLISNEILFQYSIGYGDAYYGPYLLTAPAVSGSMEWDGSSNRLSGAPSIDLPSTNNKQLVKGVLRGQDYLAGVAWVDVTNSVTISGYENVGRYFIGRQFQIYVPIPLTPDNTQYALYIGQLVECECSLKKMAFSIPNPPYSLLIPVWSGTFIRRQ